MFKSIIALIGALALATILSANSASSVVYDPRDPSPSRGAIPLCHLHADGSYTWEPDHFASAYLNGGHGRDRFPAADGTCRGLGVTPPAPAAARVAPAPAKVQVKTVVKTKVVTKRIKCTVVKRSGKPNKRSCKRTTKVTWR